MGWCHQQYYSFLSGPPPLPELGVLRDATRAGVSHESSLTCLHKRGVQCTSRLFQAKCKIKGDLMENSTLGYALTVRYAAQPVSFSPTQGLSSDDAVHPRPLNLPLPFHLILHYLHCAYYSSVAFWHCEATGASGLSQ